MAMDYILTEMLLLNVFNAIPWIGNKLIAIQSTMMSMVIFNCDIFAKQKKKRSSTDYWGDYSTFLCVQITKKDFFSLHIYNCENYWGPKPPPPLAPPLPSPPPPVPTALLVHENKSCYTRIAGATSQSGRNHRSTWWRHEAGGRAGSHIVCACINSVNCVHNGAVCKW